MSHLKGRDLYFQGGGRKHRRIGVIVKREIRSHYKGTQFRRCLDYGPMVLPLLRLKGVIRV